MFKARMHLRYSNLVASDINSGTTCAPLQLSGDREQCEHGYSYIDALEWPAFAISNGMA